MPLTDTEVRFVREPLMPVLDQLMPLAMQHDIEIDGRPDVPLDIDRDAFSHWEQAGALRCFLMRSGELIAGYGVFLVVRNPFKRSLIMAVESALYLSPGWRKTGYGSRFIDWQDRQLEQEHPGILISRHCKVTHDHGGLLLRKRYRAAELVYQRRIKDESHG